MLLTPRQAASALAVSTRTVYLWIEEGRLPSVKLSERVTRVPEDAVLRLIAANTRPATVGLLAEDRTGAGRVGSLAAKGAAVYGRSLVPAASPAESLRAVLDAHRDEIFEIIARNKGANVRVFGSVARGDATERSDVDLLVDPLPRMSLLDRARAANELEDLLGVRVDVASSRALKPRVARRVLSEAIPL